MQKVYLLKVKQKGGVRYVGKASGKLLARLSILPEMNAPQEAQRPLDEKRLKDLANFAADEGILATSVVLGSTDRSTVEIHDVEGVPDELKGQLYYIELPSTEDEIKANEGKMFNVIDGQHRLFSFLDEYSHLSEGTTFDMSFELYLTPTKHERQIIFKNTNEKQKSVSPNLLLWFRSELGMSTNIESKYYKLVGLLETQDASPLKGRIIMQAEHNPGGLKAQQMIKIMNKIDLKGLFNNNLNDEAIFKVLCDYLGAWEKEVKTNFSSKDSQFGPFSKISGVRYIFGLLPEFVSLANRRRVEFNEGFVEQEIRTLYKCGELHCTANEFFDKESDYNLNGDGSLNNYFLSETSTWELAEKHKVLLEKANENDDAFSAFAKYEI